MGITFFFQGMQYIFVTMCGTFSISFVVIALSKDTLYILYTRGPQTTGLSQIRPNKVVDPACGPCGGRRHAHPPSLLLLRLCLLLRRQWQQHDAEAGTKPARWRGWAQTWSRCLLPRQPGREAPALPPSPAEELHMCHRHLPPISRTTMCLRRSGSSPARLLLPILLPSPRPSTSVIRKKGGRFFLPNHVLRSNTCQKWLALC